MNGSGQFRYPRQLAALLSLLLLLLSGCDLGGALDGARLNPRELPTSGPVTDVAGSLLYANGLALRSYRIETGAYADLATFPAGTYADGPVVSPDGLLVAFTLFHLNPAGNDKNGADLMLMNVDGTNQRVLVAHELPGAWLTRPAWSSNGAGLYFTREHPSDAPRIERVGLDGKNREIVVVGGHSPSLSADGRSLAFLRDRGGGDDSLGAGLYVATPDGEQVRATITDPSFDQLASPRFSPDGARIAFVGVGGPAQAGEAKQGPYTRGWALLGPRPAAAHGVPWELWTASADGSNLQRMTDLSEDAPMPVWSPDGSWIALKGELGLYLVDPAGGSVRRLVQELAGDGIAWLR